VLAETYPILLAGMQQLFAAEPGFLVLACCTSGDEAVRAVHRHQPDVLILDLEIPGGARNVLRELADAQTPTRTVMLAARLDEGEMLDASRLGAKGMLLKNMPRHLLIQCVRKVHRGGTWLEKASLGRALDQLLQHGERGRELAERLSRRELEIVLMTGGGQSNRAIADKLSISEGTVKAHFHHIYEKCGVKNRLELILYAKDTGLF
jgi:DNA-binding NarL/FixJ family response regulator